MPYLSPENIIIGLQNNLELMRARQALPAELIQQFRPSSAAANKLDGRSHKQDRRTSPRRKTKVGGITESHIAATLQERGE